MLPQLQIPRYVLFGVTSLPLKFWCASGPSRAFKRELLMTGAGHGQPSVADRLIRHWQNKKAIVAPCIGWHFRGHYFQDL